MDLLAGAAYAWSSAYVMLAVFFAILAARRPSEGVEYAVFAAACVLVGGYAFCNASHYHAVNAVASANWLRRGFLLGPGAAALVLHTLAVYAEVAPARRRLLLGSAYGVAGLLMVANLSGGLLSDVLEESPVSFD